MCARIRGVLPSGSAGKRGRASGWGWGRARTSRERQREGRGGQVQGSEIRRGGRGIGSGRGRRTEGGSDGRMEGRRVFTNVRHENKPPSQHEKWPVRHSPVACHAPPSGPVRAAVCGTYERGALLRRAVMRLSACAGHHNDSPLLITARCGPGTPMSSYSVSSHREQLLPRVGRHGGLRPVGVPMKIMTLARIILIITIRL